MTGSEHGHGEQLDSAAFREALSGFPTGVTVVTAVNGDGRPAGLTVSSFTSVSLEPPLILWCIMRSCPSFAVMEAAERFAVNVLADDQADLSNQFAQPTDDKFAGVATTAGAGGVPLLENVVAQFECRTWNRYDGGDHLIIVGEVESFRHWNRAPLIFAHGEYDSIGPAKGLAVSENVWPIKAK